MKSRKIPKSIYITIEQQEALEKLSEKIKIPQSEYIREGIETTLKKYKHVIESGKKVKEG